MAQDAAYANNTVFPKEKKRGWIALPRDILIHTVKYLVSSGFGSLFQENNFAFFKVCRTFRSLRKEIFERNSNQVNQNLVWDIFARAQYRVQNIPKKFFLEGIRAIGSNRSFTRLPFPIRFDREKTLALFPHVREVCLKRDKGDSSQMPITEEERAVLAHRSLQVLEIEARGFTQEHLVEVLQNSRNSLRKFSLVGSDVTDTTIRYLANNHPKLKKITLDSPTELTVTDAGFVELAKLKDLTSLHMLDSFNSKEDDETFYDITSKSFLSVVKNLESLAFCVKIQPDIDELLPCLRECRRLATLKLECFVDDHNATYVDEHISTIAGISNLTTLDLSFDGSYTHEKIEELAQLTRLRQFSCIHWEKDVCLERLLPKFKDLEKVHMFDSQLTDEIATILKRLPKFQELDLCTTDNENHIEETETRERAYRLITELQPKILTFRECGKEDLEFLRKYSLSKSVQRIAVWSLPENLIREIRQLQRDFPCIQLYFNGEPVFAQTYIKEQAAPQNQNCIIL